MNPYQYIHNLNKYGQEGGFKPGLHRVNSLLSLLGHPERDLKVIHVAGSNGKGSTIAHLNSIYRTAGFRVGTYISPPLFHFNERMKVDDVPIYTGELKQLLTDIIPAVNKLEEEPSFFEVVTVLAFMFFVLRRADLVLLETGLGGRLDATNVIETPLAAVLTSISREHTQFLGDTIPEIAGEKAGIIKENCPVISAVKNSKASKVIRKTAASRNAPLLEIDKHYSFRGEKITLSGQSFTIENGMSRKFKTGLYGPHQVRNAVLAIAVVDQLQKYYPVTERQLGQGLRKVFWPGRLEVVSRKPLIIIDGAHNREGLESQLLFLDEINKRGKKINLILGVLNDKDIEGIMKLFASRSKNIELILTANRSHRALAVEKLKRAAERYDLPSRMFPDLATAIEKTIAECAKDEIISITGSFYTVAEAKIILQTGINSISKS